MSRVRKPGKFLNMPRYDKSFIAPRRLHTATEDCHKAIDLFDWLFIKYDMSEQDYIAKDKEARRLLKIEYRADTKEFRNARKKQKQLNMLT